MHFDVNLLTEIFRDTHTLRYQRQAVSLTVLTNVPREHLYMPNQTRIRRGRGTAYISLNTSRKARGRRWWRCRMEWADGRRWREEREERARRKRERHACVREQLGATNKRVRRGNRDRRPLGQAPEAADTGKLGRHILGPDPFAVST